MNSFIQARFENLEKHIVGNNEARKELNIIKNYILNKEIGYEMVSESEMGEGKFQRTYRKEPQINNVESIRQHAELIIQACIRIQRPLLDNEKE